METMTCNLNYIRRAMADPDAPWDKIAPRAVTCEMWPTDYCSHEI